HRGDDLHLDRRESAPDAGTRPAPEWKVRVTRARRASGSEPLRIETLRLCPEAWIPVRDEGAQQQRGVRRNTIAVDLHGTARGAGRDPRGRIEPQRFVDHETEVFEFGEVLDVRPARPQHGARLASDSVLRRGAPGE